MRTALKISLLAMALTASPFCLSAELGRLFFTPELRKQLDYSYQSEATPESNNGGVLLNGIVQKHGGKRIAWINGVAQEVGQSDERSPESLPVVVPGKSRPVKIKVGQKVLINPATPDK